MRAWLLLSTLLAVAGARPESEIPPPSQSAQGDVAVTIYNNNLALVQDTRQLNLPAGRSRQEFPDVSAQIRPETVTLTGSGVGIVEQNFDFDLLSPQALMQKAVGETITLVRTNPATGARDARAGAGARRQWRRRPPDRRADRGAARRRPAGPGDLRPGAGESARPADPVGDGRRAERGGAPAGDPDLSDPRPRLAGRLCRLVRRDRRPDGRPGLDHAHQQQRHALRRTPTPCWSPARSARASPSPIAAGGQPPGAAAPGRHRDCRAASGSAISISIRCPSGPRSPTARPSRSASSTSTARRRARAYEFRNAWLGTAEQPQQRQYRAALLELARAGPRRRAAGRHGAGLPARRARQPAIRRRERDRPHADGLGARPHHRPGVRRQGPAGGRAARARQRRALAHHHALHPDQCAARSGHRRPAQSGLWGRHPDRPGEPCRANGARPTRRCGGSPCRPMATAIVTATFDTRY